MASEVSKSKWSVGRVLWTAAGSVSLALSAIGSALPILPTTPLVLLAAFCSGKGSPRFQQMLLDSRKFGPIMADWRADGATAWRYKALALAMMAGALMISAALKGRPAILILQVIVIGFAAVCIMTRPS